MFIFSARLKALRKSVMTQPDMASILGLSVRNYQRVEYGEIEISLENLVKVADVLHVSTDYLLGRTNFPDNQL